jgi:transketolase
MHVDKSESSVSSITNSNKTSSDESSDISVSPTKTNNDHKRKMEEQITSFPRKKSKSSSHSAHPVSIISSAEASMELKTSDTDSSSPRKHCNKKQKLLEEDDEFVAGMDPATTEGQLALYPTLTEKAAKMAAKREYNRRNAARVRTRNKNMVAVLQEECACLTKRSGDLSRSNDLLTTQIEDLETQNYELRASHNAEKEHRSRGVNSLSSSNNSTVSQLLPRNCRTKRSGNKTPVSPSCSPD